MGQLSETKLSDDKPFSEKIRDLFAGLGEQALTRLAQFLLELANGLNTEDWMGKRVIVSKGQAVDSELVARNAVGVWVANALEDRTDKIKHLMKERLGLIGEGQIGNTESQSVLSSTWLKNVERFLKGRTTRLETGVGSRIPNLFTLKNTQGLECVRVGGLSTTCEEVFDRHLPIDQTVDYLVERYQLIESLAELAEKGYTFRRMNLPLDESAKGAITTLIGCLDPSMEQSDYAAKLNRTWANNLWKGVRRQITDVFNDVLAEEKQSLEKSDVKAFKAAALACIGTLWNQVNTIREDSEARAPINLAEEILAILVDGRNVKAGATEESGSGRLHKAFNPIFEAVDKVSFLRYRQGVLKADLVQELENIDLQVENHFENI